MDDNDKSSAIDIDLDIDFDVLDEYWAKRYGEEFGRFFL